MTSAGRRRVWLLCGLTLIAALGRLPAQESTQRSGDTAPAQSAAGEAQSVAGEAQSVAGEAQSAAGEAQSVAGEAQSVAGEAQSVAGEAQSAGLANVPALPQLVLFKSITCPVCTVAGGYTRELRSRYPQLSVIEFEVSDNRRNQGLLVQRLEAVGHRSISVPAIFFGDRYWVGFNDTIRDDIDRVVAAAVAGIDAAGPAGAATVVRVFGRDFELAAAAPALFTFLIATADGFNPCSLWVLGFLIAVMIRSGSRKKLIVLGAVFLVVTATVYGLFIVGVVAAMEVITRLRPIQVVVAVVALLVAAVNIKDYFFFQKGFSLTLSAGAKKRIVQRGRSLAFDSLPFPLLILATVALAGGVALAELPCTAGFPVVWANLVVNRGIAGAQFAGLLAEYLVVYLLIEIVILTVAVVTFKAFRVTEGFGRFMKLLGGSLMAVLGVVMLVAPAAAGDAGSVIALFLVAGALSVVVHVITRQARGK